MEQWTPPADSHEVSGSSWTPPTDAMWAPPDDALEIQDKSKTAAEGLTAAGQAGASMVTGMPGMIAGGLAGLGTLLTGGGLDKSVENLNKTQEAFSPLTNLPLQSAGSKEAAQKLGEAFAVPGELAGKAGALIGPKSEFAAKLATDIAMNFLPIHGVRELRPKASAMDVFNKTTPEIPLPKIGIEAKLDQLEASQEGAVGAGVPSPVGGEGAFQNIVDQLGYKEGENTPLQTTTPMADVASQLTKVGEDQRASAAQAILDARQVDLAQEVARKQSLDFNAAERARQEGSPVVSDEHRAWAEEQQNLQDTIDAANKATADAEAQKAAGEQQTAADAQDLQDQQDRAVQAQQVLDDRKAQTEFEVSKQTNLDFNAAERARQEARTIPPEVGPPTKQQMKPFTSKLGGVGKKQGGALLIPDISNFLESSGKAFDKFNDGMKTLASWHFNPDKASSNFFSKSIPKAAELIKNRLVPADSSADAISKITAEGTTDINPISDFWKGAQSGPALTAAKYNNNPLLMHVANAMNYGTKLGDLQARNLISPLEKYISTMKSNELINVHSVLKREMFNRTRFPEEAIQGILSPKEFNAYKMIRGAFDTALDIQNKSLVKLGKKPITENNAYLSSVWHGDWHTPILNKEGKLAWYVRTTSEKEGLAAVEHLRSTMGDTLDITKDTKPEYRGNTINPNTPRDVMGAYQDMLDFFKDNESVTNQIQGALQDYMQGKGYSVLGQSKHFLQKANIRGFEGDQPWKSPLENAYSGFKAQIEYLNSATRWSGTQEAIANVKEVLSNPDVIAKMPNAIDYAKTVVAKEMGIDSNWFSSLESSIVKGLGLSRGSLYRGTANLKTMTYLQILGFSPAFMIAAPFQAVMSVPAWHVKLTGEGFTHNVAKTSLMAASDALAAVVSHMGHEFGITEKTLPMTKLGSSALAYIEDSGFISRNLFDESRGLGEKPGLAPITGITNWTIGLPEKVSRLSAYMSFVHHLEASGKYVDRPNEMFRHAEELSNNAITSFASIDRPQIVSHLGAVGQMAYMFKSFLFNGINQLHVFTRQAFAGNPKPLLAALGMYAVMGGLQSLPSVNELDGTWNLVKDAVAEWAPQHYSKVEGVGVKGTLISLFSQTSGLRDLLGYGAASVATGAQLASRLNLATVDVEQPLQGLAPVAQEMKEWGGVGSALLHRNMDAALSALYMNSPPLVQGNLETRMPQFKSSGQPGAQRYFKPQDLSNPQVQEHIRTPQDEAYRKWGMYSLNEARDKQVKFINNQEQARVQTAEGNLMTRIVSAVKRGDAGDLRDNAVAMYKLNPDSQSFNAAFNERMQKLNLTPTEIDTIRMKTYDQLNKYLRLQQMQK